MEEIIKDIEETKPEVSEKRIWEVPKLYSLDKGKTEGGNAIQTYEDWTADMFS